jgi:mevalonate kinase
MTTASAPGKIILFGEHAVVYHRPALAVPVLQVHADARADFVTDTLTSTSKRMKTGSPGGKWQDSVLIDAPDIGLFTPLSQLLAQPTPHPLATVIISTFQAVGVSRPPALRIRITSTIPVASGLGSGAAVSVAIIRALSLALSEIEGSFVFRSITDEQVNSICYETEKLHHGTPSGIDNTVITYAKPVYFVRNHPIETFHVGAPFTIIIADTGISALTKESVGDLRKLWEADKSHWETVFDEVGEIVQKAKKAIESGKWQTLGPLMDANHLLLQEMTVSSPELDRLVLAAKAAGALGAKLSGGGRGGNMIALVTPQSAEKVASALKSAGAKNTIVTIIE